MGLFIFVKGGEMNLIKRAVHRLFHSETAHAVSAGVQLVLFVIGVACYFVCDSMKWSLFALIAFFVGQAFSYVSTGVRTGQW